MLFKDEIRPVKIDHLAWTMSIGDLKNLDRSNDQEFINLQLPVYREPAFSDMNRIDAALEGYKNKVRKVLIDKLDLFLSKVMGLRMSSMRGRGLHGYEDSMVLTDMTRTREFGLVGFGGNNDTIWIQINGHGCTHVFERITPQRLHWWLAGVLGVTRLGRLDLAVDDYTGNFDCRYAEKCFYEGAFRTASRGRGPTMVPHKRISETGVISEEATIVGSRTSSVYWRVYNKKLEQKIVDPEVIWYRNEVELKKCDIDMLASPASAFAGLCPFAASIEPAEPVKFSKNKKAQGLEFFARIAWVRRIAGLALAEIVAMTEGDLGEAFGMLIPHKHRRQDFDAYSVVDAYSDVKQTILELRQWQQSQA